MGLGYRVVGSGKERVLVLHDWFCDCSCYEQVMPYLDHERFSYAFVDLRGYGQSQEMKGDYSLEEAANDLLLVADELQWPKFHLVGNSMTVMIAQKATALAQERVVSMVAITPIPASGPPVPKEVINYLEAAAQGNDTAAQEIIHTMTGNRYTDAFARYKVIRWKETTTAEARVGYASMFSKTNFVDEVKDLKHPLLVILGAYDFETNREQSVRRTFLRWYPHATVINYDYAGHYPAQEVPVALASAIERFILKNSMQEQLA